MADTNPIGAMREMMTIAGLCSMKSLSMMGSNLRSISRRIFCNSMSGILGAAFPTRDGGLLDVELLGEFNLFQA